MRAWRVLIVEDARVDREIYKGYLRSSAAHRFEFAEAETAASGIDLVHSWEPDCVLLDFNLPDMDGLEVLQHLCRDGPRPPSAVIMLTACGGEELAVNALKSGAMDYLPKGQMLGDVLPQSVANAIERFRMQVRIEEQRAALEKSAARYQTLLEAIPHMVWMTNAAGQLEYANRLWFEYGGLSLEEGGLGWDRLVHPQDRERSLAAWEKARESGAAFEVEHRLRRASDGSYRWQLTRAVPFRGSAQEIASWFGACTEIENQKQAENINLQREKVHGIGMLAAGVAHDFNNLLVAILGGASFVMENLPSAHPSQAMLEGVVKAAERAAELTGKMLAYAGKAHMHVEWVDLNKLVRDTCEALRVSVPKTIRLTVHLGRDVPEVRTDSRQMRQTIIDLVRNSVEAIREGTTGTITVRTGAEELSTGSADLAPGKYAVLEVKDTGCGMNEDTQNRIFDPFFTTKFTGRGLGLAAVKGFVRSSGGDVRVYSRLGRGSRFLVLLPAVPVQAKAGGMAC